MNQNFIRYVLFFVIMSFHETVYATGYGNTSLFQVLLKLLLYIGIFIVVIIITLYGTRLIAKNYKGYGGSKYIKLLDTLSIPGGIKIVIMEINEKIYILSLSSNTTEVVDILNKDEFIQEDFNSYLDKHTNKNHIRRNLGIDKIIEKLNFSKDKEDEENEKKY